MLFEALPRCYVIADRVGLYDSRGFLYFVIWCFPVRLSGCLSPFVVTFAAVLVPFSGLSTPTIFIRGRILRFPAGLFSLPLRYVFKVRPRVIYPSRELYCLMIKRLLQ